MFVKLVKKTWPFEKAEKIKNLYFAKLDEILGRAHSHEAALASLAANDTSVLQTLVYLVEQAQASEQHLVKIASTAEESRSAIQQMRSEIQQMRSEIQQARSEIARLEKLVRRQPWHMDIRPGGDDEPELGLIAHLAPLLPRRVALDIGANIGKYSEVLLRAGFEVHAFEPNPTVLASLRLRLGAQKGFTPHGLALGARDGNLPLHLLQDSTPEREYGDVSALATLTTHALPAGLAYAGSVDVPVRTLEGLQAESVVPTDVGYVKVDTEGFDLDVIRGMGSRRYPVVSVEFWDKAMEFGKSGTENALPELAGEMQARGYGWWIVIYRVWGDAEYTVRFYSNVATSVQRSWGNAFFFSDRVLFEEAERWCAAVLPRTYFSAMKVGSGAAVQQGDAAA